MSIESLLRARTHMNERSQGKDREKKQKRKVMIEGKKTNKPKKNRKVFSVF